MTRAISLTVLLVLILLLGGMMYHVIAPFILPLFLAAVLAVICQPLHNYFLRETGQRKAWAAALSTSALVAIVVIPVMLGTFVSGVNLYTYANEKFDGDWHIAVNKIKPLIPRGPWDRQIERFERQIRKSLRSFAKEIVTPRIVRSTIEPDNKSFPSSDESDEVESDQKDKQSESMALTAEGETQDRLQNSDQDQSVETRGDKSTTLPKLTSGSSVSGASANPAIASLSKASTPITPPANAGQKDPATDDETEETTLQSLIEQIAGPTFQVATSIVSLFVSVSIAAGTFITALYYFLADGPDLIAAAERMIPLPVDHQRRLCERFSTVVRAVVTATFLAALAQGVATAIALRLCGYEQFLILLMIATVASLIPLIGAWIVWLPCAVWLAVNDQWTAAILLTLWGALIVSMLDNVIKMYVLQNDADLHPLLAFISVVGALQVLGVWGIFIGPIVASCLFALIQIFNSELQELAKGPVKEITLSTEMPPKESLVVPDLAADIAANTTQTQAPSLPDPTGDQG